MIDELVDTKRWAVLKGVGFILRKRLSEEGIIDTEWEFIDELVNVLVSVFKEKRRSQGNGLVSGLVVFHLLLAF